MKSKPRVIKDYDKLDKGIKEQIKLEYPEGYSEYLIEFTDPKGLFISALPFETEDRLYMVRMSVAQAEAIIDEDDDFDSDGILKDSVKDIYEEKYDSEE